jgi:hypothetical protein
MESRFNIEPIRKHDSAKSAGISQKQRIALEAATPPLLHARRPVGRPRKVKPGPLTGNGACGKISGDCGVVPVTLAVTPVAPRLLNLHDAALYLGVSEWTVRGLVDGGILKRVRIPLRNQGELRKLLFDLDELDRLIDTWKD